MGYGLLILIHVSCGALWASIAWFFGALLMPAVGEAGPGGPAVVGGLMKRRMTVYLTGFATLTVLSGLALYGLRFGLGGPWNAEQGVLALGGLITLHAYGKGLVVSKPLGERLGRLGAQIAAAQGKPEPAWLEEMAVGQAKMARIGRATAYELLAVLLLMAAHRLAATF